MERIQDFFQPVVAGLLRQAPFSPEKLVCAWRMAVGADVARVSHVRADAGTITVVFDDGRWQRELERSRRLILERLQSVLGPDVAGTLEFTSPTPLPRQARGAAGRARRTR